MFGDVWLHKGVKGNPVHAYPSLIRPDLPKYWRIQVELAPFACKIFLIRLYLTFLYFAAERAASLMVGEDDSIWFGVIV